MLTGKERLERIFHHEEVDRPACICPGGMMNMITTDLMDVSGITWPEAHTDAQMMAKLALASYENGCFENVGVPHNSIEKANLNPDYTFENFIVGESNRFAHATSLAVAENPGKMYNPLFIYGNSGLGKTHLMQAIGNYIVKNTSKRVLYVTSEDFISDFLGINKRNKDGTNLDYIDLFKDKYRNIDVLIIDDIQFLGTAPKTQNEFFHTFNNLYMIKNK